MKTCRTCKELKPKSSEYFHIRKDSTDGFRNDCKECRNKKERMYRKENKDKIQRYYDTNRDKINERKMLHYYDNREHYMRYKKIYTENNKKRIKDYYQRNKEKFKEYGREYHKKNPHISRQKIQRRLARKKQVPNTFTLSEWNYVKTYFNNECAYCGLSEGEHLEEFNQTLHQEHVIPLAKKGGYTACNIIPSCKSCNSQKSDSDFIEWYRGHEHYDKDKELKIMNFIEGIQKSDLE